MSEEAKNKKGFIFMKPLLPVSDPVRIQTWNLLIRSQMLYSIELRGRKQLIFKSLGGKDKAVFV